MIGPAAAQPAPSLSGGLSTGSVGLARADVGEALGAGLANSGFSAVIPASALQSLKVTSTTLYVYLLTPGKGSYFRTLSVGLTTPAALEFPNDPIVVITRPQEDTAVTQRQRNSKFTFLGFALDRN